MIELHLDGRFLDVATQTIDVTPNAIWQPRETTLKQQEPFFLHESMANSLLFSISDTFMPKMITNKCLGAQLA
jgi:hypothetical protein